MSHFPYRLTGPIGSAATLGLIALQVDETIEQDFRRLFPGRDVALYVNRIPSGAELTPDSIAQMGRDLPTAAALLPQAAKFDAVAYGCTSGTTLIGVDRVRDLVQGAVQTRHVAQPLTATLTAFSALEISSIGLVSPYIDSVSGPMQKTFEAAGYRVPAMVSFGEEVEANVARIDPASIHAAALEVGKNPEIETVFLSCTNLRTLDIIEDLEQRLGKPVVSSNQALAWHMAHLSGAPLAVDAPGVLFQKPLPENPS
ncbi:Arylmalonate decarboxylase [Phaeobacter sp. CECT 5382]|uniref:maleate cis-trans isomerase family protein n=1 Tax=Phaeobacter sp. CECT 5382 TaxID=1712645 RepID=UPI0006DA3253|nr:aspartate/glutamate racemase family protein [Phaeobacter sp. CECT 5382]CUH86946.1 Arylmalonate decarboxylase [Phaeobacter sp. CECT 5382]